MTLDLEIVNEGSDMGGWTWGCFHDVSAMISCPHDSEVGICTRLCVYAFEIVRIVVYDMGGCHMSVLINFGEVNCVCGCVMDFMVFLVYFRDNNHDIITPTGHLQHHTLSRLQPSTENPTIQDPFNLALWNTILDDWRWWWRSAALRCRVFFIRMKEYNREHWVSVTKG